MQSLPEVSALLGFGVVFVLLFITLGPIKILGPFMQLTRDLDEGHRVVGGEDGYAVVHRAGTLGGRRGARRLDALGQLIA